MEIVATVLLLVAAVAISASTGALVRLVTRGGRVEKNLRVAVAGAVVTILSASAAATFSQGSYLVWGSCVVMFAAGAVNLYRSLFPSRIARKRRP